MWHDIPGRSGSLVLALAVADLGFAHFFSIFFLFDFLSLTTVLQVPLSHLDAHAFCTGIWEKGGTHWGGGEGRGLCHRKGADLLEKGGEMWDVEEKIE